MVVAADHCLLEADYKRQRKLGTASITLVKVLCSHRRNVTQVIKQDFMHCVRVHLGNMMCSNEVYKV